MAAVSSRAEIVAAFDAYRDAVSGLAGLSVEVLTTPERLGLLERLEQDSCRLPVVRHALLVIALARHAHQLVQSHARERGLQHSLRGGGRVGSTPICHPKGLTRQWPAPGHRRCEELLERGLHRRTLLCPPPFRESAEKECTFVNTHAVQPRAVIAVDPQNSFVDCGQSAQDDVTSGLSTLKGGIANAQGHPFTGRSDVLCGTGPTLRHRRRDTHGLDAT